MPQRLAPVLQVAILRFEQDKALRAELEDAKSQLSARKTIERAKGILMEQAGVTEDAAHKHLRKLAMDRGQKLADAAERIIEARDLLRPAG